MICRCECEMSLEYLNYWSRLEAGLKCLKFKSLKQKRSRNFLQTSVTSSLVQACKFCQVSKVSKVWNFLARNFQDFETPFSFETSLTCLWTLFIYRTTLKFIISCSKITYPSLINIKFQRVTIYSFNYL